METTKKLMQMLQNGMFEEKLSDIYVDAGMIPYQTGRYMNALKKYEETFGEDEVAVFSAPGRSEIGGNHTDHQHGEVLAASINLDAIAVVKPLDRPQVRVISDGYDMIEVDLQDLSKKESENETTIALIKGVLYGIKERGYCIGGFQAYITSDVLIGAGLSSSAAYETLIGAIVSGLYNDMRLSGVEIAMIGQFAENVYFNKPCGLMDQMACSVGNLVHIDFSDIKNPRIEKVDFDLNKYGYSLCITDTKGSHADLTADYAAVPKEMKAVAAYFGKEYLIEVDEKEFRDELPKIRQQIGDRAVLRAFHFYHENARVRGEVAALKEEKVEKFLWLVNESGNSSFRFLQNVYSNSDVQHQNVSVALAVSEDCLFEQETIREHGVCRVHGGGFAGTIQAFVKNDFVDTYRERMDAVFGTDACKVLKIRKYGGIRVL